ncbi:12021_t:CDS:2 [Gigaspora margarita]|uniref:12021_t:CDS:1 n=1 Tax=Gigaspora margarita TaxID=4874 RepID=A0ABN7VLI5_GIGMA|nr:12021_t:CDS:2 [Gigaspora margarita]
MAMQTSSLNDLAQNLIKILNRNNIFPPAINNPEELIGRSAPNSRTRRPPNGFLLCRKNVHKEARSKGTCNMRVISKVTGMLWREASAEEKETYEQLALDVQSLHSQKHPGYRYRPTSRSNKSVPLYHPYMNTSRSNKSVPLYNPYLNTSSVSFSTPMTIPQVNYQTTDLLSQSPQELDYFQYYQTQCNNLIDDNEIYPLYPTTSTWQH